MQEGASLLLKYSYLLEASQTAAADPSQQQASIHNGEGKMTSVVAATRWVLEECSVITLLGCQASRDQHTFEVIVV